MNVTQIKCLFVFVIFVVIGFGPISPTCLIGMYIIVVRPMWFFDLVGNLYDHYPQIHERFSAEGAKKTKRTRIKSFWVLLGLFIVDIAPVPVASVIAISVIFERPLWFVRTVASVYGQDLETDL